MTVKEVARILLYQNKGGFRADLKELYGRIADLRGSNTELSSVSLKLAIPANRGNSSTVEICVIKNCTLLDLEVHAREMERFINRLESAVATLPEKEKQVISLRYFNRKNTAMEFFYIAAEMNYSEDWCKELNKRALEILAVELHGVQVTWGEND